MKSIVRQTERKLRYSKDKQYPKGSPYPFVLGAGSCGKVISGVIARC